MQVSPSDSSSSTQIDANAVRAVCGSGGLTDGTLCQSTVTDDCPAGRRPVPLADGNACALCRAGSYSPYGSSCTSCAAGKYVSTVGATACTASCLEGSYSTGGAASARPLRAANGHSCSAKPVLRGRLL